MLACIRLLNGFEKSLTYAIPPHLREKKLLGMVVRIPLQNKIVSGFVHKIIPWQVMPFVLKDIIDIEPLPHDEQYVEFNRRLAYLYQIDPVALLYRLKSFVKQEDQKIPSMGIEEPLLLKSIVLTEAQQAVVDFVKPALYTPFFQVTLLHGVTGSGKTEVYKCLMKTALAQKKSVLFLLPEVTLAMQFTALLRAQLGVEFPVATFHSGSQPKEKRLVWQNLLDQKALIIVGVHLPVHLPIANLGLIIIDEEHDTGYQEKKHPKINSKDAALLRAQLYNIPIILGSATPSVSSLYNVEKRGWHFFQLKERFGGIFPQVSIVSLLQKNKKNRPHFWITHELHQALSDCLSQKRQAIIFINRRGYSFFVQCRACSYIFSCQNCSVSLTLHEEGTLSCHYCGYTIIKPSTCTACGALGGNLLDKGLGTQYVASLLKKIFPQARIARADMDVTVNRKVWNQTVEEFHQGAIDILVGTQTITKGYHFPNVTLVGVIWADLNLSFPWYNAAEIALQQLIQVAGRAGRSGLASSVIVQTMMNHPIFSYINELDYSDFYRSELLNRDLVSYPPICRLAEIELKHDDEKILEQEAIACAQALSVLIEYRKARVVLLGPAKPPVHKIKNEYSRKIYLKSNSLNELIALFSEVKQQNYVSRIFFVPNSSG